jgi:glucuronoarabinoxylan endo-1,4-beta-xylanase
VLGFVLVTSASELIGAGPVTVTVDYNQPKQTVDGFGAAITWIAGDLNQFSPTQQTDLLNKLFSTDHPGAGLSYIRGGTFLCEFNPAPGIYNWNHPLIQDEMAYMNRVKAQYGVSRLLVTTWTPPAWMKDNNSCSGGGHVLPSFYPDLAATKVQWLLNARATLGIDVAVEGVQNEPSTGTSYDSALYTPQELNTFVVDHLKPAMQAAGLSTRIMVPEGAVYGGSAFFDSNWGYPILNDPAMRAAVDIMGTHGYGVSDMGEASQSCLQYNKPIWQTEDSALKGRYNGSISDGLSWGKEIAKALNTGNFSAWFYWWATTIYDNNGGLIAIDLSTLTYKVPKRVYVMGNFSRFIRPGAVVLTSMSSDSSLLVTAVRPDAGTVAIVLLNSTKQAKTATVSLQNLSNPPATVIPYRTSATEDQAPLSPIAVTGGGFAITVPANSVVTVVGN